MYIQKISGSRVTLSQNSLKLPSRLEMLSRRRQQKSHNLCFHRKPSWKPIPSTPPNLWQHQKSVVFFSVDEAIVIFNPSQWQHRSLPLTRVLLINSEDAFHPTGSTSQRHFNGKKAATTPSETQSGDKGNSNTPEQRELEV